MNHTFHTHNDGVGFENSSLRGYINTSYLKLVEKFGVPAEGDGYKVDAEWTIKFDDGLYCTIYNYKDGKNYYGEEGIPTEKITEWHIGGNGDKELTISRIKEILSQ